MKNSLFLIAIVAILTSCSGERTDLEIAGLKGEVSLVTEHL